MWATAHCESRRAKSGAFILSENNRISSSILAKAAIDRENVTLARFRSPTHVLEAQELVTYRNRI
jgi:hypothetical protein